MEIELTEEFFYELVFEMIFRVPECPVGEGWGCLTGDLSHDLIFSLFLPHIILLIFLFMITRKLPGDGNHGGLQILFGIGAYVFIVYTGIYGILTYWLVVWMAITLFVGFLSFFTDKIFGSPSQRKLLGKKVGEYMKKSNDKREALRHIQQDIDDLRDLKNNPNIDPTKVEIKIRELESEKRKIQRS